MCCAAPPIADQPQPAAVASMTTLRLSAKPSWSSGRSPIANVMPFTSSVGRAASQAALASATTPSSTLCVSGAMSVPAGAAAAAVSAPSLSTIVTTPTPSAPGAPEALVIETVKVSSGSTTVLLTIATWKTADVAPALIVSVDVFAWKSVPAVAVPATVVIVKVTFVASGADSVTVIEIVVVPELPSVTVTSATYNEATSLSAMLPVALAGEPTA